MKRAQVSVFLTWLIAIRCVVCCLPADCLGIGGAWYGQECIWTDTAVTRMTWEQCWAACRQEPHRRMIIVRDAAKQSTFEAYVVTRYDGGTIPFHIYRCSEFSMPLCIRTALQKGRVSSGNGYACGMGHDEW